MNKEVQTQCDFDVIAAFPDKLFIVDLDLGNRSVTNDAENVAAWAQKNYQGRRLIYRDSMGRWDEIIITVNNAVAFIPYAEDFPVLQLAHATG